MTHGIISATTLIRYKYYKLHTDILIKRWLRFVCTIVAVVAMHSVAQLASYWNLPVIGWMSSRKELSDKTLYTTLVRTFGPLDKIGNYWQPFVVW